MGAKRQKAIERLSQMSVLDLGVIELEKEITEMEKVKREKEAYGRLPKLPFLKKGE